MLYATKNSLKSTTEQKKAILITLNSGRQAVKVKFPFDHETVNNIKTLDSRKYYDTPLGKYWICAYTHDNLQKLFNWGFEFDDQLRQEFLQPTQFIYRNDIDIPTLKKELYPYQKEGVAFIEFLKGRAIIGDEMGLGKAQPYTSKILTKSGWKTFKDVSIGEPIFGEDGKLYKITGIYPQGEKDIYRVTFSDGTTTECCDEHLWASKTTTQRFRNSKGTIQTLREIIESGITYKNGDKKYFIPITKQIQFATHNLPIDPYILGILLGDGSLKQNVHLTNSKKDIIKKVKQRLPNDIQLRQEKKRTNEYDLVRTNADKFSLNRFRQVLKQFNLNVGSHEKYIPDLYKYASISQRIDLLNGILDTDGWTCYNVLGFSSSSEQLCDDVQFLIESLGGTATKRTDRNITYKYKGEIRKGRDAYTLTINLPENVPAFSCEAKSSKYKAHAKYKPYRAIKKIEFVGRKQAMCIATSNPTHLYLTDHLIVTHNTAQALAWLELHPELRPAIVLVPASLKGLWAKEAAMWMTNPNTEILFGKKETDISKSIVIVNYEILSSRLIQLIALKPKVLIIDEIHNLMHSNAKQTKAGLALGRRCPYIIGLSGTVILNRPIEAYNAIRLIKPTIVPTTKMEYGTKFCKAHFNGFGWDFNGASNLQELHEVLSKVMIRRLKSEVLPQLPPKVRSVVPLEITNRKEYENAEEDFIKWIKENKGDKAAKRASNAASFTRLEILRQIVVKGKMKAVISWIEEYLSSGNKLVLYMTHRETVRILMEHFKDIAVSMIRGMTTQAIDKTVEDFQTNNKIKLLIGILDNRGRPAGVGHTFTAAPATAFVEMPISPGICNQAEDRTHRIGTIADCVYAYYLLAEDTVEIKIAKLIDKKRKISDAVHDGVETEDSSLLMELLNSYYEK
jgi:hypothetical protein